MKSGVTWKRFLYLFEIFCIFAQNLNNFIKRKFCYPFAKKLTNKKHNELTKKVNKIAVIANEEKGILLINFIETFAFGTSNTKCIKMKKIKCNSIIKRYIKLPAWQYYSGRHK